MHDAFDAQTLHAWLSARSAARGLPAPIAERGGYRVETNSPIEIRRWVFAGIMSELVELAASIHSPGHVLKVCASVEDLAAVLPAGWQLGPPSFFMRGHERHIERPLPADYTIHTERSGAVSYVWLAAPGGEVAASGYAAETDEAFVYDRIATAPDHGRKGLGRAVMCKLQQCKVLDVPELLVATEQGRALYETLGWKTVAPYSSASLAEALPSPKPTVAAQLPRSEPNEPRLGLLGFADGLRIGLAARGQKLRVQVKLWQPELFAQTVDALAQFVQFVQHRRRRGAGQTVSGMIEQAPLARRGYPQRGDQGVGVFDFKLRAANVEAFETVCFGHS